MKHLILLLLFAASAIGQTLVQEYAVKQEYKKANIRVTGDTLYAFGKMYRTEETYFTLQYTILDNGDYVCILNGDGSFDHMINIAQRERRYEVNYRGGMKRYGDKGQLEESRPSIWILRKDNK